MGFLLVVSEGRGYLLPNGECFTDEYECCLVAIPAKDEYRRAFFGALDYFGTWRAWERDTEKRGKDAALAWVNATEITRECWEMGFCDDMLTTLQNIELLLSNKECCGGSTTVGDTIVTTTVIVPGVGGDPTEWGETPVADWDEWSEYVCYYANKFVDDLIASAETLDTVAEIGAWTVEFFANILRVMQFLTLVYPVSYAAALSLRDSFTSAGDLSDSFDSVAAAFEAGRNDIVCAFMTGSSVSDAVESVLDDATLWTLLYQFNNYDATQALVYEGSVDGEVYLPPIKRDDCECLVPLGYSWQEVTEITYVLSPNSFSRINEASVSLPEITVGRKNGSAASWGCTGSPNGLDNLRARHADYPTLAMRLTCIDKNNNGQFWIKGACRTLAQDESFATYYTYDVAEGIDATWAATQSTQHILENSGHAKRAADFQWDLGLFWNFHTVPVQDPIESTWKLELLVWSE